MSGSPMAVNTRQFCGMKILGNSAAAIDFMERIYYNMARLYVVFTTVWRDGFFFDREWGTGMKGKRTENSEREHSLFMHARTQAGQRGDSVTNQ